MKKLTRSLILLPVLLVSCYWVDVGNWNSRAAFFQAVFSNLPDDVARIHVAVFDGYPGVDNLLLTSVFNRGDSANITVPAGPNRWFVIAGENYSGLAQYQGISGPYNMSEGGNTTVVASMQTIDLALTDNGGAAPGTALLWNSVEGAAYYELFKGGTEPADEFFEPYSYFANAGFATSYSLSSTSNWYAVRAYLEMFDLYSWFSYHFY